MENSKIILDFIAHTDFAAAVRPSYHCPGAVKVASTFQYIKQKNPEGTILLDAGDILVGSPIINLTQGEPVMEIVNLFSYDAMTLGNHEFDQGRDQMYKILPMATFPLLCANIIEKETGRLLPFVKPYILIEKKGVKIGILGVTTAYTPFMVKADAFKEFGVLNVVETCNRYIPQMKNEGAEIIVVLGHLPGRIEGNGEKSGELFKVADSVQGIDILIGGHNPGDIAISHNGILVSKTGFSAKSIGHIQIKYDQSKKSIDCIVNEIVPVLGETLPIALDPVISTKVDEVLAPFIGILDEVIGEALDELIVSTSSECSLGNFFTDCIREACNTQLGVINSTSCFGFIPKGPITSEMIMWVMCFNDNLFTGQMSGKQIRDMLELTYETKHLSLNGTLQLSGLKVVLDSRKPEFQKIISIRLDTGELLQENRTYLVATSAYIASGGNEYLGVTSLTDWQKTELMSHSVLINGMKEKKVLQSQVDGRIVDLANKINFLENK